MTRLTLWSPQRCSGVRLSLTCPRAGHLCSSPGLAHSSPPSANSSNPALLNQLQLLGNKIVPGQCFELFLSSLILTCPGSSRAVRAAGHRHFGLISYTRKTFLLAANSLTLLLPAPGCLDARKALKCCKKRVSKIVFL